MSYAISQGIHWGLTPADITRQHANPTSGQALFLSAKAKREAAAIIEPIFRKADLRMMEVIVSFLRARGVQGAESMPLRGYTVTYAEIPESPAEEQGRRDNDDWQAEKGMLSRVELYQRWNPGSSRDDAIDAYVTAATDDAEIQSSVATALGDDAAATDDATGTAFNELTLATERLLKIGDINGINQLRRTMATTLGVAYSGDLTELPGASAPTLPATEPEE